MPNKRKKTEVISNGREFVIPPELLGQGVKGPMTQSDVEPVCRALKEAVVEPAKGAELSQHLAAFRTQTDNLPQRRFQLVA